MAVPTKVSGDGLILSSREALVAGGPAEEFESRIQGLFKAGYRHLVTDLPGVTRIDARRPRATMAEVEADGREFPTSHVQSVFARTHVIFEPREVSHGKELSVRYHTLLNPDQSLESLSEQLMGEGKAHVRLVSWELPGKSE